MYEQAKKYFTIGMKETVLGTLCFFGWLISFGLVIVGFSVFINDSAEAGTGIVCLLIGAAGLYGGTWAFKKLSANKHSPEADAAYDALVQSMMNFSKDDALAKLGLDESEVTEAAPVCISGYSFDNSLLVKRGMDGKWRSDRYETWYMFFSSNEVHCCKKAIKTTENWKTVSTDVYFYKDIVSVSTTSESKTVLNKKIDYDCFVLTTAGGTAFKVSLKDVDDAQRSVNAMRSLLRAKKQEG